MGVWRKGFWNMSGGSLQIPREALLRPGRGQRWCGRKILCIYPGGDKGGTGRESGQDFCRQYGITGHGNFEGRSIPNLLENDNYEEICEEPWGNGDHGGNICHGACDTIGGRENEECRKLYQYRLDRARLHKDDKILVSWNSWMICACAMAGAVLGEEQYVDMAVRADAFIKSHLVKNGRLMVRYRDGDAAGEENWMIMPVIVLRCWSCTG